MAMDTTFYLYQEKYFLERNYLFFKINYQPFQFRYSILLGWQLS